jgi:hypothetical protein
MELRKVFGLLAGIGLIAMLVLSSCAQPTAPSTTTAKTASPAAAVQQPVVKVLNPGGLPSPVDCKACAPRIDSLTGKKILFYQSEATNMQLPTLLAKLQKDYPTATFDTVYTASFGEDTPSDKQKTYQASIRGVAW